MLALVINAAIMAAILILVPQAYETNDDYAIALRIVEGETHVGFIDYYLCVLLVGIQKLIGSWNAFVLFQIAASFAAFVCLTKAFFTAGKGWLANILFVLLIAVYSFDHYSVIQFTKTAGLLAVIGVLLLIAAVTEKRGLSYFIPGIILMFIGSAFRIESMVFALAFGGLYFLFWIIGEGRSLKEDGYLTPVRGISLLVALVFVAGTFGLFQLSEKVNTGTDALQNYREYDDARTTVVDYPVYDHFKKHPDEYAEAGITQEDMYLIDNWYLDYDGAATKDRLQTIAKVYKDSHETDASFLFGTTKKCLRHIYHEVRDLTPTGMHIIILVALALFAFARLRPRYWIYVILVGGGVLFLYWYLFYIQRPAYRASYVIDWAASIWLLYYIDPCRTWGRNEETGKIRVVPVITATLTALVLALALAGGGYAAYERGFDQAKEIKGKIRPDALAQKISEDRSNVYVFSTRLKCNPETYAKPLKKPERDRNVFTFGSWGTESPYLLDRMGEYAMSNVFGDTIDNNKVYVVENKNVDRMEEYMNRWYRAYTGAGRAILYDPVDEVDGYKIWQVITAPIQGEEPEAEDEGTGSEGVDENAGDDDQVAD